MATSSLDNRQGICRISDVALEVRNWQRDEFSSGGPGSGNYLRFFFVCQATHGTYPRCFTMYTSKGWRRKYPTLQYRKGQAY